MKVDMQSNIGRTLYKEGYTGQRVGLELEYEHCKPMLQMPVSSKWHTEADHSLRTGGIEFISTPLSVIAIKPAIVAMLTQANAIKAKVTKRCGLHVHLNMTHMTWGQMFQFCTYYTLLEPELFKTFAPGREASHFCVPTWSNTALTEYMYADGQRLRAGVMIPETATNSRAYKQCATYLLGYGGRGGALNMIRTPKYAALNVSALKKFGTLEFRQAPSSLDVDEIYEWTKLLLRIQSVAMRYTDPTEIVMEYDRGGLLTLCEKVGFKPSGGVDELDQEDAADAATIMAGHIPVDWKSLEWELK